MVACHCFFKNGSLKAQYGIKGPELGGLTRIPKSLWNQALMSSPEATSDSHRANEYRLFDAYYSTRQDCHWMKPWNHLLKLIGDGIRSKGSKGARDISLAY